MFLKIIRKFIAKDSKMWTPNESGKQKHWKEYEYFIDNWSIRVQELYKLLPEVQSIIDLGCGKEALRNIIPRNTTYIPVDYIQRTPQVIVCDFNAHEFPNIKADAMFVSGLFEYIIDPIWFIKNICAAGKYCAISYCSLNTFNDIPYRRQMGWINDFTTDNIIELFDIFNFKLLNKNTVLDNDLFCFASKSILYEHEYLPNNNYTV